MESTPSIPGVAQAGISLYQAGGFALLLLFVGIIGTSLMAWVMIKMINRLNDRLDTMQDNYMKNTQVCINENTQSNREVITSVKTLTEVMRERLPVTPHSGNLTQLPRL